MKLTRLFFITCILLLTLFQENFIEAKNDEIIAYKDANETIYFKTDSPSYKNYTELRFVKVISKNGEIKYWFATNNSASAYPQINQISSTAILNIGNEIFPIYEIKEWEKEHYFIYRSKTLSIINIREFYQFIYIMPVSIFEISPDVFDKMIDFNNFQKTFITFTLEVTQEKYNTRIKEELLKNLGDIKELTYDDYDEYKTKVKSTKVPFL